MVLFNDPFLCTRKDLLQRGTWSLASERKMLLKQLEGNNYHACKHINSTLCSGNLKFGCNRISNGPKRSVCKWSRFWMGTEIWKPDHLKSRQMLPFCQNPLEIWTKMSIFLMVWFSNSRDHSFAWIFENQTFGNLISNVFGFQRVQFQILTLPTKPCCTIILT